ncbi:MAG: Crp/Fnr family transcriptional regulator [Chitinophagales bacterium]
MNTTLKNSLRYEIADLSETALNDFMSYWNVEKKLKRHELLYPKGRVEDKIYFIKSGSIKICYEVNEQEMIVGFGYENSFIFDLPAFFTSQPSHFYMQAIKSCELIGIRKKDFYDMLDSNMAFAKYWRKRTEMMLLEFIEREIDILTNSPEERFRRLKKRSPAVFQHIPHKYIAYYLRMTPETLSRLKKS